MESAGKGFQKFTNEFRKMRNSKKKKTDVNMRNRSISMDNQVEPAEKEIDRPHGLAARSISLDTDKPHVPAQCPEQLHKNCGRVQGRRLHNYQYDGPGTSSQMKESPETKRRLKNYTKRYWLYDDDDDRPEYAPDPEPSGIVTSRMSYTDHHGGKWP